MWPKAVTLFREIYQATTTITNIHSHSVKQILKNQQTNMCSCIRVWILLLIIPIVHFWSLSYDSRTIFKKIFEFKILTKPWTTNREWTAKWWLKFLTLKPYEISKNLKKYTPTEIFFFAIWDFLKFFVAAKLSAPRPLVFWTQNDRNLLNFGATKRLERHFFT